MNRGPRLWGTAAFALAVAVAPGVPVAQAKESCSFNASNAVLKVKTTKPGERTRVFPSGGVIHVDQVEEVGGAIPLVCAGGNATTTTVDRIKVRDTSEGNAILGVLRPEVFAPGKTAEMFGADEIEWTVRMGPGKHDGVFLTENADDAENDWRAGTAGINLNPTGSLLSEDLEYDYRGVEEVEMLGADGDDVLSARGNAATGDPFPGTLNLAGGYGIDTLRGGPNDDSLSGYFDEDRLEGGGGDDELVGGPAADELLGNGGVDTIDAVDSAADTTISCGAGDNAKESALLDDEDPDPISC